MRELGATVVPVKSGSRTLKDAVNEAVGRRSGFIGVLLGLGSPIPNL